MYQYMAETVNAQIRKQNLPIKIPVQNKYYSELSQVWSGSYAEAHTSLGH